MNCKILIVSSEFPPGPGGIGNHAYSLSKSLTDIGHDIFVLTDADHAKMEDVNRFDKQHENIKIERVWRSGFKTYLNRIKQARALIKREKVDLVIFSGKFSLWLAGLLSVSDHKFKSIGVLHGSEVRMSSILKRNFTNWCIKRIDYLLPVSKFTHSLLSISLQSHPFEVIENGIDTTEMAQLNEKQESNRTTYHGNPSILTVGNVTPRKGQQRVIKSLPTLVTKFPDLHYHIVGLPTFEKEFTNLAESLGVSSHVTFHGRLPKREDLSIAYNSADCFMILSENQADGDVEGFGIVVLEANFFGVPVIGANGCGIADAIDNNYNGYLVDGDDAQEISDSLSNVLLNKIKLEKQAKIWANNHDWKEIGLKYNKIIQRLLF